KNSGSAPCTTRSLTDIATRSMPMPPCSPVSIAILSLVPTPSVAATSTGSLKPAALRSNSPPKPPISASAPARAVARTIGLMRSTRRFPASISTPESAYVSPFLRSTMPNSSMMTAGYEELADPAKRRNQDRKPGSDRVEHSKYHYTGTHHSGADHRLGDRLQPDGDCLRNLRHCRRQRRRRRLPGQALQHAERTG